MPHTWVRRALPLLAAGLLTGANPKAGEPPPGVTIEQAADRSVTVTGSTYVLRIEPRGTIAELSVKGTPSLQGGFSAPVGQAPSINLLGSIVAVRAGTARVEYTCEPAVLKIEQEGYGLVYRWADAARVAVRPDGKGGPIGAEWRPNSTGIILENGLTLVSSLELHIGPKADNRIVPSAYCSGQKKEGDLLQFSLRLGDPAEATQFLSAIEIAGTGVVPEHLRSDGNQGQGVLDFADAEGISLRSTQRNTGTGTMDLEYRLTVLDHYTQARTVAEQRQSARLEAGKETAFDWRLPRLSPGFYYATVAALKAGKQLTSSAQTFTVDVTRYRPPLTRPADFKEFWERVDQKFKAAPLNADLKLISDAAASHRLFEVALGLRGGTKTRALYCVPDKPAGPAVVNSCIASQMESLMTEAQKPGYKPRPGGMLCLQVPRDATYSHWNTPEDSNLFECIVTYLRGCDFLAGRPEMAGRQVIVEGASRSGPLAFIAAARRPEIVCGVSIHVPTSCGISWLDKPYTGWGGKPGHLSNEQWTKLTAYLDPINHAPDVTAAFIVAYGIDDGLSPPQGIEAMFQHSASKWKRISRDAGGHQYSAGFQQLQKNLDAHLHAVGSSAGNERILKEH